MTRKTVNKKLIRQNPVIPPIKEGEELVDISSSGVSTNPRIEREANIFFCNQITLSMNPKFSCYIYLAQKAEIMASLQRPFLQPSSEQDNVTVGEELCKVSPVRLIFQFSNRWPPVPVRKVEDPYNIYHPRFKCFLGGTFTISEYLSKMNLSADCVNCQIIS